jgi:peptidoglycan hydrolase FlgJ
VAHPSVNPALYTDPTGLASLKLGAKSYNAQAIREAAKQFESLFTRMMLKSMREASFGDPLFGSDQDNFYRDMGDDQLAGELSKGRGLGLADMLIQQLTRAGLLPKGSDASGGATATPPAPATAPVTGRTAGPATTSTGPAAPVDTARAQFVRTLWPYAQSAGRELGVDPTTLLAHAALETGWGQSMPSDASGTSFNLFGVKASAADNRAAVASSTIEYQSGQPQSRVQRFRAYSSTAASFQDYVNVLRSNPRYAAAIGTGADVQAFATALQNGGYGTDPSYAAKLTSVAATMRDYVNQESLKGGPYRPITTMPDAI